MSDIVQNNSKKPKRVRRVLMDAELAARAERVLWDSHIEDVIEIWRSKQVLWDDEHPEHLNQDKCNQARQEMCEELSSYIMLNMNTYTNRYSLFPSTYHTRVMEFVPRLSFSRRYKYQGFPTEILN